jgi:CheY-like chemotaxis protein
VAERKPTQPYDDIVGALHDVSNALTVLLGWVASARAEGASQEQVGQALAMIEESARSARDLARRSIGVPTSMDPDAPFDAIVGGALRALEVEAERAEVRLVLRGAPGVRVTGTGDVANVLTNLVLNALAHAPRASEIVVDARAADGRVVVDIADHGPGIDPARASTIFEGDSTRDGGAGVGLRHARSVARAAGGDLELVATSQGARFRLTWPHVTTTSIPPAPMSQRTLYGTRVLVVEDDADVASLLETALGARGATVTIAKSAAELERAAASPHDAALIDLSPIADDVSGAVERVRAGSPDATLVVISGSAVGIPDVLADGAVHWVRKPFEISEVVAVLTRRAR